MDLKKLSFLFVITSLLGCLNLRLGAGQTISKPTIDSLLCYNVTLSAAVMIKSNPFTFTWVVDDGNEEIELADITLQANGTINPPTVRGKKNDPLRFVVINIVNFILPGSSSFSTNLLFHLNSNESRSYVFKLVSNNNTYSQSVPVRKPTCPIRPDVICVNSTCLCDQYAEKLCADMLVKPEGKCGANGSYVFTTDCPAEYHIIYAVLLCSAFLVILIIVLTYCQCFKPFAASKASLVRFRKINAPTFRPSRVPVSDPVPEQKNDPMKKTLNAPQTGSISESVYFSAPASKNGNEGL